MILICRNRDREGGRDGGRDGGGFRDRGRGGDRDDGRDRSYPEPNQRYSYERDNTNNRSARPVDKSKLGKDKAALEELRRERMALVKRITQGSFTP